MMSKKQREAALIEMQAASDEFYRAAIKIGNHPFLEFAGVLNEYIKACQWAHDQGIDFTECNVHSGINLPLEDFQVKYLNEKLACIFTGRSVVTQSALAGAELSGAEA